MDASSKCVDLTGGFAGDKGDTLIVKIIANSNALSLNNDDNDTTATGNIYKGVELYPGEGIDVGMFGMYRMTTVPSELCLNDAIATGTTRRICSTYSNYVTYADA